jgi:hypothetical protein
MNFTDIYRIFHPIATDYIFFSTTHGTFSKLDHILGHKANLNKQKIEVIPCILTDHNRMKSESMASKAAKSIQTHGA